MVGPGLVVRYLGWVDIEYGHSTVCPVLLGQMKIWQNWMVCWARWRKTEIKVNQTQLTGLHPHPVPVKNAAVQVSRDVDLGGIGNVRRRGI